jgi:hypothetical protein
MTTETVKVNLLAFDINEVQFTNLLEEYYGKVLKYSPPTPTKWIWEVEFSGSSLSENEPEFASALDNAKEFYRLLKEGFSKPDKNNKTKKNE